MPSAALAQSLDTLLLRLRLGGLRNKSLKRLTGGANQGNLGVRCHRPR